MNGWPAMGGTPTILPPGGNGIGTAPVNPGVMIPNAPQYAPQPAQPTGQFVVPQGVQGGYGLQNLPPAPQQQPAQGGFMGQVPVGPMGQYGLPGAAPQTFPGPQGPMQYYQAQGPAAPQQGGPQWPLPQQQTPQFPQQPLMPGLAQGYPQQPTVPVNPAGPVNAQTRLDGPNVPPELRGRTIAEAMSIYNSMATMAQGYGRPSTPPAGPQQYQQTQGSAPGSQPQVQGTATQQGQQPSFWQNPEQRVQEIVGGVIDQRLGPVVQFTHMQAVTGARMAAQQQVPDFAGLEQDIMGLVQNASPDMLANPNTWIGAADVVRGRQMREGRYRPPVPGQGQAQAAQAPQGPSSQQLPVGAFFTEAPAAPSPNGVGGTPVQPTQQDIAMAQKFRMPIEEWMAWKFGVQPVTNPNPNTTLTGQGQPTAAWHYGPFVGGAQGARGY